MLPSASISATLCASTEAGSGLCHCPWNGHNPFADAHDNAAFLVYCDERKHASSAFYNVLCAAHRTKRGCRVWSVAGKRIILPAFVVLTTLSSAAIPAWPAAKPTASIWPILH